MQTSRQSDDSIWRRRNADDCVWAKYGESCVVYHRPSGVTHLLNGASYRLLSQILIDPTSLDAIVDELAPESSDVDLEEFRVGVLSILLRLEYLGLIEKLVHARND